MIRTRSGLNMTSPDTLKDKLKETGSSVSVSAAQLETRMSKMRKFLYAILLLGTVLYGTMLMTQSSISTYTRRKHVSTDEESITVVMNTFKRHDLMIDAVNYYASCPLVKYIYVIWSEKDQVPGRISAMYENSKHPEIAFVVHKNDSLNNRFLPLSGPHSDAVFSVDDDMRVPCEDLGTAMDVWRGSSRTIVGFMPRLHLRSKGPHGGLDYRCWWRVWWHGAYSIILTKAAIFHHDYLELYSHTMPASIRQLVDDERNCEDIAMQFLISNSSSLAPVYVKGHLSDLGAFNGISTSQNVLAAKHMDRRSECLNMLVSAYGKNPLVLSHIIVDSASNKWTNSPSTWLEYISSDLWKFN